MKTYVLNELADGSFSVHLSDAQGNVWPTTVKPNAREAVARLMQLLQIGPVAPQIKPEKVCIGSIETCT
jgi:hypothetical protein